MTFSLGAKSIEQLKQVHPRLVTVVNAAIIISIQDFGVHDGGRTAEEQNALFKNGKTQKDGYRNKSNHQITADGYGHSVDLVPYLPKIGFYWDDWNLFYPIASAMSIAAKSCSVRIKWGGNWYECMNDYGSTIEDMKYAVNRYKAKHPGPDFIDGPHFELA